MQRSIPGMSILEVQRVPSVARFAVVLVTFWFLCFVWKACVAWESLERARRMDGGGPCSFPFVLRPRRLDPVYLHNKVCAAAGIMAAAVGCRAAREITPHPVGETSNVIFSQWKVCQRPAVGLRKDLSRCIYKATILVVLCPLRYGLEEIGPDFFHCRECVILRGLLVIAPVGGAPYALPNPLVDVLGEFYA